MKKKSSRATTSGNLLSTFTYYLPAPPHRKNGYREREFDKIMQGILTSGFELQELHTQAVENGVFIVALLRAKNKKTALLDENLDIQERFKLAHTHSSPDIILEEEDE